MTDEQLTERLRHYAQIAHAAAAWGFAGEGEVISRAADRIEALIRERDDLEATAIQAATVAQDQRSRAEAAEAKARDSALAAFAAYGQAQDAYEAQLKAEARVAELEAALLPFTKVFSRFPLHDDAQELFVGVGLTQRYGWLTVGDFRKAATLAANERKE